MVGWHRTAGGSEVVEIAIASGFAVLLALVGIRTWDVARSPGPVRADPASDDLRSSSGPDSRGPPSSAPVETGGGRTRAALLVATLRVALADSVERARAAHVVAAAEYDALGKVRDLPNVRKIATAAGERSTTALASGRAEDFRRAADVARQSAWAYDSVAVKAAGRGIADVAVRARAASSAMRELAAAHETNRELKERFDSATIAYTLATDADGDGDTREREESAGTWP
ncbi:MAG: hypothetical protein U0169_01595 [Polyangiaceae bacterium]